MQEELSHYVVCIWLDQAQKFVIWFSGETDGLVLFSPKKVASFSRLTELEHYAAAQGIELEPDSPVFFDFDGIEHWLTHTTQRVPDCALLLDAWNFLSDVAACVGDKVAASGQATKVYDKLFFGSNIPAIADPVREYEPVWTVDEIGALQTVLQSGLRTLRSAIG